MTTMQRRGDSAPLGSPRVAVGRGYPVVYNRIAPFHPDRRYPEYPFGERHLSSEPNPVYDLCRRLFFNMGYDVEHYETADWNPLGRFIRPGDRVLIKPNMVLAEHGYGPAHDIFSVITHPSLVRCLLDYVYIALAGRGTVVIGDAPLQTCDFSGIESLGYSAVIGFFVDKGVSVSLKDFRLHKTSKKGNLIHVKERIDTGRYEEHTPVALDSVSMHREIDESYVNYRVTNYDPAVMRRHHDDRHHEYLITNHLLDSDVVINVPKPKTHRKCGITAAMKNFVGINGHKDWLPHHRKGAKSRRADEYLYPSLWKRINTCLQEYVDVFGLQEKHAAAWVAERIRKPFGFLARRFSADPYFEGSWWGNDTMWRTVHDLCTVALYADRRGLNPGRRRKILHVGDMFVTGDEEGPLEPTPIQPGILLMAEDMFAFDLACAALMDFDHARIPSIVKCRRSGPFPITDKTPPDVWVVADGYQGMIYDFPRSLKHPFRPTKGWRGHIESAAR